MTSEIPMNITANIIYGIKAIGDINMAIDIPDNIKIGAIIFSDEYAAASIAIANIGMFCTDIAENIKNIK